jgi:NodT family efflux transporter outer membrane factor (OMF) lipoprotein
MMMTPFWPFKNVQKDSRFRMSKALKSPVLLNFSARATVCAVAVLLAGCAVGPRYEQPAISSPTAWQEAPAMEGWLPATPSDTLERGPWWQRFNDPELNALAERVQISNQNIAAAVASYSQAQALVREQGAALLPSLSLNAGSRRAGTRNDFAASSHSLTLGADWAPDLWGRLRATTNSAEAAAQASAADLAAARLSALGALASNYFSLREADTEIALLDDTIEGYERAQTIARNRYAAGLATSSDVLQAETQLLNTRAERQSLVRSRAVLQHAIAVLVGLAPAEFRITSAAWTPYVPAVPTGVPSTLLQRRPDIAAAERSVAQANASIGIAIAGYYPDISLTASAGTAAADVGKLFDFSALAWAVGATLAQTIFDGGATDARVESARAGHTAAVARYRQTVLTAFQDVEDQLSASASLAQQEGLRRAASANADKTEQQMLNRYRAGQVSYSDVVTAQASALSARRTLVQLQVSRQTSAVALIQALGGGWQADWPVANTTDAATKP